MKKKLSKISVLLVLMLTLAVCFAFGASAEETTYTEGNYTYTVTDGKATITDVSTWAISGTHITPTTLGGYPVTAIGERAYRDCTSMTGLIVSEGVKTMGSGAFYGCDRLKSVVISEGVETIGSSAFTLCESLKSISLPDSLTSIEDTVFTYTKIKEITIPKNVSYIKPGVQIGAPIEKFIVDEENPYFSADEYGVLFNKDKTTLIAWPSMCSKVNYTVPDSVKKIEIGAFSYANRFEGVTLPEGLEEIGEAAFCITGIKSLHIPASVKKIGVNIITYSTDCETLTIDEDNQYYCAEDGVIYSKDKTELVMYSPAKKNSEFVIPSTVTKIHEYAFEETLRLRKITVTNDFEVVYDEDDYESCLFSYDTLETIVFKENVTNIPDDVFCKGGFPKSVYIEGMDTELDVRNLSTSNGGTKRGVIDEYIEEILTYYKMVYNNEYSYDYLENYSNETFDKYNGEYVNTNYLNVYCHEGSKADLALAETDKKYTQYHVYDEESDWLYNSSNNVYGKVCLHCSNERLLFDFTVENNEATITKVDPAISGDVTTPTVLNGYPVTAIADNAFEKCVNITNLVISEGVKSIGSNLFLESVKLESLILPDSLTTIGESAFVAIEVEKLNIPKNVSEINEGAFVWFWIKKFTVDADNPYFSSDESGVLFNKDKTELIHYPICKEDTIYTVPSTVKTIAPFAFVCGDILEKVVLPEGVETIGKGAFYLDFIKEINIPSTVTSIHPAAFMWAFDLEKLTVAENNPAYCAVDDVLYNKDQTVLISYPNNKAGREYVIPDSVNTIYSLAFQFSRNLKELTLSKEYEVLDSEYGTASKLALEWGITDLVFGKEVESIDSFARIDFSHGYRYIYIENDNLELSSGFGKSSLSIENISAEEYVENFIEAYRFIYGSTRPSSDNKVQAVYYELVERYNKKYDSSNNQVTIYCHEGSKAYTFAQENHNGYNTVHFYEDGSEWVFDFENNTATRECVSCTVTEDIYEYSVTDGEARITGVFSELTGDVYVPETLGGYPVTEIGYFACAFDNLYIHEGIKGIAESAFEGGSFGNIIVDENNPYFVVEDGVLYDINKERLIKYFALNERTYFELPETVVKIDALAFGGAVYLEEIKLNEGLKEIGFYAFAYTNISNIEFPSTLETIGEGAFVMCPMLKEFTVPANVKNIGSAALFTYFPVDIYLEGADITFDEYEFFGVVDIEMDCTREEFAEFLIYAVQNRFSEETDEGFEELLKYNNLYVSMQKFYCHEGASFIEQMDAAVADYGVEDLYEYTHFFKNWTYDWEGLERTAKCLYCDETTTESLRSEEDNEIEFIAPADEETTFVVETVEDEASDNYILVTEALEAVEGPAEIEKIYDITLETSEGVAVQPDGSVQVKLPVEESHGNYKVFRVNDDGTYTDMNATVVDGYVVFVTDHFSLYVVVDTTEKTCEHEFDYTKSEANLKRPSKVDGTWVDGYYTYTCSLCGETETEVAKRADYTEYYVVETRFAGVLLNEDIDVNIRYKLLEELQATEVEFTDDFIESEQQTLDRFTDYLLACTERAEVCVAGTHYFTKYEEVTAPKCGVAGLEKSVCDYCGAEDENEIPALKHSPLAAVKEKEVAPTCEAAGSYDSVVYCDLCGEEISRETVTVSAKGHTKVTVPGKAATCKETGLTDGVKCSVCGKILTAQKTIAKADHKDKNGDYKCDYGCGHEFERPTPDKCDHMCHQSGFMGFIWKIVQFFWKLFKMNPVCECGAAHY